MRRNTIFFIIAMIVVIGVIILLALALLRTSPRTPVLEPQTTETPEPAPPSPPSGTSDEVPPFADNHNILDECVAFKMSEEDPNQEFEDGKILVTFERSVSFNTAVNLIESNDAELVSEEEARTSFESGSWFAIEVPRGQEYRYMCVFESSDLVRRAVREPAFNLAQ